MEVDKEEINAPLLITKVSYHEDINKVIETTVNSHEKHQNKIPLQTRTIVPPDLHHIQPRATQVWNCDKIVLEPKGKWHKVGCTYKYFQG